jgi:hypothetical protein
MPIRQISLKSAPIWTISKLMIMHRIFGNNIIAIKWNEAAQ